MDVALQSELLLRLGFRHGFSLRTGGVSSGSFATLNLGRSVGDDPRAVAENAQRFAHALEIDPARIYEASQVHGRAVVRVDGRAVNDVRHEEADALVARTSGDAVAVRTADCVPILIGDPKSGAVSAVHAGWRGVAARIVDAALDALSALGAKPTDLVVAIGPHIREFEVGEDVAETISAEAHGENVVRAGGARPHVELSLALRAQLHAGGIDPARIDDIGGCTFREPGRFFSHRRDGGHTGRHLAVIRTR